MRHVGRESAARVSVCFQLIDMTETHRSRRKWAVPVCVSSEDNKDKQQSADAEENKALAVPFRGHISGGLCPGKKLVLVGLVDPRPNRFYVALTCGRGSGREPPPDVALELCVRFADGQVLRRACVGGAWGGVERGGAYFPFIRGQPFKMEVRCEVTRLRVLVDGQLLFDFQHRISALSRVDTLWIKGNVRLNKLA